MHEFPEDLPEFIDDFQAHVPENIPECDLILALDLKGDINMIRAIPVEIELLFLAMVLFELVGGDALGLYVRIPHYDNFMHFMLPLYVALIGMMAVYTMYFYGKLKASVRGMAILIVIVTIGFGAMSKTPTRLLLPVTVPYSSMCISSARS